MHLSKTTRSGQSRTTQPFCTEHLPHTHCFLFLRLAKQKQSRRRADLSLT